MITLLDVLSVADRKTGNGFVVRDLTPLEDGQETFPGFAMAARFKRYAKVTNQSLDKVMHRHFIIPFARSIAKILLRYGLLIEFPHDQNYLVRFDSKSGQPLDQIAWRDLSDTIPFLPVLESSGNLALSRLKAETLAGAYRTSDEVSFEFHQGHPKFLRGFDNQDAYHEQISIEIAKSVYKELGVPYKKSMLNDQTLSNLLNSPSGRSLIKAYHERLRTEQSRRKTED